jgi:hypothetical protein
MEPDDLLCSRNARPPKALVGRAQWKINQPPSLKRSRASLVGAFVLQGTGISTISAITWGEWGKKRGRNGHARCGLAGRTF